MPGPEFTKIDLPVNEPVKKSARGGSALGGKVVRKRKPRTTTKKTVAISSAEEKKITQELKEIYQNDDGTMPNMSDFKKKKGGGFFRACFTLLFCCLFFGAVAWAGFFFLQPKQNFTEQDVVLSFTGASEVKIGKEVSYRVRYRNAQSVPLSKVVLQVKYPEGFVFSGASRQPTNEAKDEWTLGSLGAQEGGYVDIVGKLYNDIDKNVSFRAFLNYTPANFNSEFQRVSSLNVVISDAPVELLVQAPKEVVANTLTDLVIDLKKGEEISTNLALVVEPGKFFSKVSSDPESDKDNLYQWSITELKEDQKIKLKGNFMFADGVGEGEMVIKVIGWRDNEKKTEPFLLRTQTVKVKVIQSELSAVLTINGAIEKLSVQPGEVLNISLALKNSGQSAISDISARLILDTPSYNKKSLLNWTELKDKLDGNISGEQVSETTRRGIIVWDGSKLKGLRSLAPGADVHIDLSIPLKAKQATDLTDFTGFLMTAISEIKYSVQKDQKSLSTNQIQMTVNSDLAFDVQDKKIIGTDGKETHEITWLISNSFHEIKNLDLSAEIYGDTSWPDQTLVVPAGEAKFDPQSKKMTWKIGAMPVSVDVLALKFNIVLNSQNPTQTQLVSKVSVKGTDAVTGQEITLSGDEVKL